MREFRLGKNTTEHYTSFQEMAAAFGRKPFSKRTKDQIKLKKQQENFLNRHLCPTCKQPMRFIGGNILVCANEKCNGIKNERIDKEGNIVINYSTSFQLLDEIGADIAQNILQD